MKLYLGNREIKKYKTKRPKFGEKCCWMDERFKIDDRSETIYWECMRGQNYYISLDGQWYRIPFFKGKFPSLENNLDETDINKIFTTEPMK
jgi:hypothetical protein